MVSEQDERKNRIISMHNDISMLRQVRKAINDIGASLTNNQPRKAEYQLYLLRKMIDQQPSRTKPWSSFQQLVLEEFEDEPKPLIYTEADRSFDSSAGMGE